MSTDIKITHKQIYSQKAVRANLMIHELPMTRPRNVSNGVRNVSKRKSNFTKMTTLQLKLPVSVVEYIVVSPKLMLRNLTEQLLSPKKIKYQNDHFKIWRIKKMKIKNL